MLHRTGQNMNTKNDAISTLKPISVAEEFTQLAASCDIRRLPQLEEYEVVQLLLSVNGNLEIPYSRDIAITAGFVRNEMLYPTLQADGWMDLPAARLYRKLRLLDDHALILLYARIYWWWRIEDSGIRELPLGECFNIIENNGLFPGGLTGIECLNETRYTHGGIGLTDWGIIHSREYIRRLPCYAESLLPLFNPSCLCHALWVLIEDLKDLNVRERGVKSALIDYVAGEAKYHAEYYMEMKFVHLGGYSTEQLGPLMCLKIALLKVARNSECLMEVDWIQRHLCNDVYITLKHYLAMLCLVEDVLKSGREIIDPNEYLGFIKQMVA